MEIRKTGQKKTFSKFLWKQSILLTTFILFSFFWASSAFSAALDGCVYCHGDLNSIHQNIDHIGSPNLSGQVALFPDNGHDDAGQVGTKPYFAVNVQCSTCHNNNLPRIHGNDCSACHPSPYDTIETAGWNHGCQQGGCHAVIHEDSFAAHAPFENSSDPANDCYRCHSTGINFAQVPETKCLNCHAAYSPGDTTPPITTTNALANYIGPARIVFSIVEPDGKVGIGRTFYRLDSSPEVFAASSVLVTAPGSHTLEFWSTDQAGNVENPTKTVAFNTTADTQAPVTTSNAISSYIGYASITLSATDNSTLGVKNTYYKINGGPTQTGTSVYIPGPVGTTQYTLTFWSEDWAGNVENMKTATFTIANGPGILRLVWGDSDAQNPQYPPQPGDSATWTVRRGGTSGPVVATGSSPASGWDGVDEISVAVGYTYYVLVQWYWAAGGYGDVTDFPNVQITTPGQVQVLRY